MLDLEEDAAEEDGLLDVEVNDAAPSLEPSTPAADSAPAEAVNPPRTAGAETAPPAEVAVASAPATPSERRRNGGKR
jgi:hypothetical protein